MRSLARLVQPPRAPTAWFPTRWPTALAWIAALDLACLPLRDFWYPDEPDIARVTLDMVARGDFLQPYLLGKAFDDYPPLFYWVASVFGRVGAWSELALRLPTMLCALALLAALGAWAKRRIDERAACWTVLVLGSAYTFHWQSINMHLDMLLALGIGCAVLSFDRASSAGSMRARLCWYAASALSMGIASLTKGPIGLLFPGAVLGLDLLLSRAWRRLVPLALCGVAASAVFLAWAAAFAEHSGGEGLVYFLTKQNLDRFRGGRSHEHAPYYYLGTLWMDLAPWTLLLVPAAADAWHAARRGERAARLALCWLGFGLVFFSAAASKRSVYLLPVLPAAGLLLARYIAERIAREERSDRWARAQVALAAGVLALAGVAVPMVLLPWLSKRGALEAMHVATAVPVGVTLLGCATGLFVIARRAALARTWSALVVLAAVAFFAVHAVLLPSLDQPLSAEPDARWLAQRIAAQPKSELAYFGKSSNDPPKESTALEFYGRFAVRPVGQPDALGALLDARPATVILARKREFDELERRTGRSLSIEREILIGDDEFVAVSAGGAR